MEGEKRKMSRWTRVDGTLTFFGPSRSTDENGNEYFPFPEEQLKVRAPVASKDVDGKGNYGLVFNACEYSLPRLKPILEKAISSLPQGEGGLRPMIWQDASKATGVSSGFSFECEEKAFEKAIDKMYASDDIWHRFDCERLKRRFAIDVNWVTYADDVYVAFCEDIRDCSGEEFQEALEDMLKRLKKEERIEAMAGSLDWEDEWDEAFLWSFRPDRKHDVAWVFEKRDRKTGRAVWKKEFKPPMDEDDLPDWDADYVETKADLGDSGGERA